MNILGFMKGADINAAVKEAKGTRGAVLLDVRDPGDFNLGHIPGAVNLPSDKLNSRAGELDKKAPIYVYCQTGVRSSGAAGTLKSLGFTNVKNIGGINSYKGELEKAKGRSF